MYNYPNLNFSDTPGPNGGGPLFTSSSQVPERGFPGSDPGSRNASQSGLDRTRLRFSGCPGKRLLGLRDQEDFCQRLTVHQQSVQRTLQKTHKGGLEDHDVGG